MNFHGELTQGGRVVLDRVAGTISGQSQADGSTAFSGTFLLSPGQSLGGGDYTLYLDDGSSHGILLGSVAAGPHQPGIVPFQVSGSMDEPPQPGQYFRL